MKPPHLSKKTADPLQLVKSGTAYEHAGKPHLPKAFRESLAALERKDLAKNNEKQEPLIWRTDGTPILHAATASPHCKSEGDVPPDHEAAEASREQEAVLITPDAENHFGSAFNIVMPGEAGIPAVGGIRKRPSELEIKPLIDRLAAEALPSSTAQPSGVIRPVDVKTMIRDLPPVQETAVTSPVEHLKSALLRKSDLPFRVTARSTHLPPAMPPVRPDDRGWLRTENSKPLDAPVVEIHDAVARVSQPFQRSEAPRIEPQVTARARFHAYETQPAEQPPPNEPLIVPPQPAAQPFPPSPERGVPLGPERITATVVTSAIAPDPKGHPVKSLTLQLHPDELGAVTVTVRLKPKEIALRVEAESEKTLGLLQRDENVLRQVLHAAGYEGDRTALHIVLKPGSDAPPSPANPDRNSAALTGGQSGLDQSNQRQSQPQGQKFHSGNTNHDDGPLVSRDHPGRGLFV